MKRQQIEEEKNWYNNEPNLFTSKEKHNFNGVANAVGAIDDNFFYKV